jgi:hypothetical protein
MADQGYVERTAGGAAETFYFRVSYPAFRLHVASGWNLASIPLTPDPARNTPDQLFEFVPGVDPNSVWGWSGGAYANPATFEPMIGYWLYNSGEPAVVAVEGTPVVLTTRTLEAGWNLIGPAGGPEWQSVAVPLTTVPAGAVTDPLWGYDSVRRLYEQLSKILPGQAAWIRVTGTPDVDLAP